MAKNMALRISLIEKILNDTDSMPLTRGHIKELGKLQDELCAASILVCEYNERVARRLDMRPHAPVRRRKAKRLEPEQVLVCDEIAEKVDAYTRSLPKSSRRLSS